MDGFLFGYYVSNLVALKVLNKLSEEKRRGNTFISSMLTYQRNLLCYKRSMIVVYLEPYSRGLSSMYACGVGGGKFTSPCIFLNH